MVYSFRKNKYKSLSGLFKDFESQSPVGYMTFRNRFKKGWDIEDALFNNPERTGTIKFGPQTVENIVYDSLADVAKAYDLGYGRLYRRYTRSGYRGNDLIPKKFRKDYVKPKKDNKTRNKFFVQGRGFKSAAEASRHYGVKYITYRKRKYAGYSPEQCLGLEKIIDGRSLRKGQRSKRRIHKKIRLEVKGKIYKSYASLARDFGLKPYVVNQRIKRYGWTPEEAVNSGGKSKKVTIAGKEFKSFSEAARAYKKSPEQVRALMDKKRQGLNLEQALGIQDHDTKLTVHFEGKTYKNMKYVAKEYEIKYSVLSGRLQSGLSIREAINAGERIIGPGAYSQTILNRDPKLASSSAYLYFVSINHNEKTLYKVGITKQTVKSRLKKYKYKELIKVKSTVRECFEIEQKILKNFSKKRMQSIDGGFKEGFTEVMDLTDREVAQTLQLIEYRKK